MEERVHQEMNKLRPEIQAQVESIIESKKSLDDILTYVRCPYCHTKVSKANKIIEPPEGTQQKEDKTDEQSRKTSTLRSIGFIKK
jgi:hypothetical protein